MAERVRAKENIAKIIYNKHIYIMAERLGLVLKNELLTVCTE